jgi:hypothetical protein
MSTVLVIETTKWCGEEEKRRGRGRENIRLYRRMLLQKEKELLAA